MTFSVTVACLLLSTIFICVFRGNAVQPMTSRYELVKENKNWNAAHVHCVLQHNAKLVIIANQIDQLRLQQYLETVDDTELGACRRLEGYGVYLWTAGYVLHNGTHYTSTWMLRSVLSDSNNVGLWIHNHMNFNFWNRNQPDNGGGVGENCVSTWIHRNYEWNDERCNNAYCFVCENRNINA